MYQKYITVIVVKQKSHLRQTIKKCSSYFITELIINNSEEEINALAITEHTDSPNNEKNGTDAMVPCSSGNPTTPQLHLENDT